MEKNSIENVSFKLVDGVPTKGVNDGEGGTSDGEDLSVCSESAKPRKAKVIRLFCADSTLEFKLFQHFVRIGRWERVMKYSQADYAHYTNQANVEWDLAGQRVLTNKIPGIAYLAGKKEHNRIFNLFKQYYMEEDRCFPLTFLIPEEYEQYARHHTKHAKEVFISKIDTGSEGVGVKIVMSPKDLSASLQCGRFSELVVQRYVPNPLLINGLKHDLRLYVLITSVEPMIAFLNEEGLARFCVAKYTPPTASNKNDVYAHLSNYSINKENADFKVTQELEKENTGSKQTLSSYWKSFETQTQTDSNETKTKIVELIRRTLRCLQPYIKYFYRLEFSNSAKPSKMFHIIGFDVLLDDKLSPWLLEINSNPAMDITFTTQTSQHTKSKKPSEKKDIQHDINPVDLHVKSLVYGDAVSLALNPQKNNGKSEYKSYKLIYNPEIVETEYDWPLFDGLLDLYTRLQGLKMTESMTSSKFCKLKELFVKAGETGFSKVDFELVHKKIVSIQNQMNFDGFVDAVTMLVDKSFKSLKDDRLSRFSRLFEAFRLNTNLFAA